MRTGLSLYFHIPRMMWLLTKVWKLELALLKPEALNVRMASGLVKVAPLSSFQLNRSGLMPVMSLVFPYGFTSTDSRWLPLYNRLQPMTSPCGRHTPP